MHKPVKYRTDPIFSSEADSALFETGIDHLVTPIIKDPYYKCNQKAHERCGNANLYQPTVKHQPVFLLKCGKEKRVKQLAFHSGNRGNSWMLCKSKLTEARQLNLSRKQSAVQRAAFSFLFLYVLSGKLGLV